MVYIHVQYLLLRLVTCVSSVAVTQLHLYIHTVVQEAVADTLEQLWISYNNIEKLKGIAVLKKLKVCHRCCTYGCTCVCLL